MFVHGLQGHPQKTWSCKRVEPGPAYPPSAINASRSHTLKAGPPSSPGTPPPERKKFLGIFPHRRKQSRLVDDVGSSQDGDNSDIDSIYWPKDLLPVDCPTARIMTWGYDTVITKGLSAPTNKSNIFSHAKDLLYALDRERPYARPLIFVAHSLGGILVKEVTLFYFTDPNYASNHYIFCFSPKDYCSRFLGTPPVPKLR